jgi:ubiquinone/menaquinone biosynthesis C-methylase UbiE
MAVIDVPMTIGPQAYEGWRATSLGSLTEAIEQRLVLELMGDVGGIRLLDAGCGDGALVCAAAARGAEVTGVDSDPAMLAAAQGRAANAGVRAIFLEGRAERLPFPDASFDMVSSITVLCFVPDAGGALREMARVLRPGGRLVLGELGRCNLWAARRRVLGWLGSRTWKAARFRTAGELRTLAEQAGLLVTMQRSAIYYPPVGVLARLLAPFDPWLGRITTIGAAFIAMKAIKP